MANNGPGRRARCVMLKALVGESVTPETPVYLALSTAAPGDNGQSIAEPTIGSNGYTRKAIAYTAVPTYTAVTVDTDVTVSNNADISWTSSGGGFSTGSTPLTHIAGMNASTGTAETVFVYQAPLAVSRIVNATGITLLLASGDLTVSLGHAT